MTTEQNGLRQGTRMGSGMVNGAEIAAQRGTVRSSALASAAAVDVIVPVFNALEYVKPCLASLHGSAPSQALRVIVVNDGSNEETTAWLRAEAERRPELTLIEHPENRGYTRAINTGLRATSADYVVLLNSDTLVSQQWLTRMLACVASSPRVGIVGPLSNAASWQSVPMVKDANGFAVNELPPDLSIDDVAAKIAEVSSRRYPRTPFVNGFCFLITRAVLDAIGLFDEEAFPLGYGEENDFCIRARKAGFELAIADDAYVFHAKSKSFGHERRTELSQRGSRALRTKHGDQEVERLVRQVKQLPHLDHLRRRLSAVLPPAPATLVTVDPLSLRILFLLPVKGGGGGANSVVQEVTAMCRMGVNARIAVRSSDLKDYERRYQDVLDGEQFFVAIPDDDEVGPAEGYDVVVATIYSSVNTVARMVRAFPEVLPAYYVQDYEPLFFGSESAEYAIARGSYTRIPGALLMAKTDWIIRTVQEHHDVHVRKVSPSIDHEVYRPARSSNDGVVRVVAMVRPQTPRRGAERTMRVLREMSVRYGSRVAIHVFGCHDDDPRFQELVRDFPYRNYGPLTRLEVAQLLRQSEIFIDLSDYQAFGRTALEAMASGCATIVPLRGGSDEYALHQQNAMVVETMDETACADTLGRLIEDAPLRGALRRAALTTASAYSVHRAAISELDVLSQGVAEHRRRHCRTERRRLTLIPSRTSGGSIAGSGYVRLAYPWRSVDVRRWWSATVMGDDKLPNPGSSDIAVLQRDSGGPDVSAIARWLKGWRSAGGKLVFEVDDDLLDEEGLVRRGLRRQPTEIVERTRWLASVADAVIVSTQPLFEDYRQLNGNVLLVPNVLDPALWCVGMPRTTEAQFVRRAGDPIRIGYIGTRTHDADLQLLAETVARLRYEYGDAVSFEVVGAFEGREPLWGKRIGLPKKHQYPDFVNWLQRRIDWDIGVIPLVDDRFGARKSNVKYLEYSALRMASICSDVPAYRGTVRHGENGLLVSNDTDAWYGGLKALIDDPALRERLSRTAYGDLVEKHTTDASSSIYLEALETVYSLPRQNGIIVVPSSLRQRTPPAIAGRPSASSTSAPEGMPSGKRKDVPQALVDATLARQPAWQRKWLKLRRDPEKFIADSKSPVVRAAGTLLRWKR